MTTHQYGYARAPATFAMALVATGSTFTLRAVAAADVELTTEVVAEVEDPTFVTHPPGDRQRLFILGRTGEIHILQDGLLLEQPFIDLTDLLEGESSLGFFGLAFDPDYQTNGFFYVTYTAPPDGDSILARFQVSADPDVADPKSQAIVLRVPQPNLQHNSGWIGFSPIDGYLYVTKGDGAGGGLDPDDDAQNLQSWLGKIYRIDVSGDDFPADPERNYAIPPDNPFVDNPKALDEIWAWGLRNPWRCSFDQANGNFYIADVGSVLREEVSFQRWDSTGGENYGWDCREGTTCTSEKTCICEDEMLVDPLFEYERLEGQNAAIIGGYVYRGCAIPQLAGMYIFFDYAGRSWALEHDEEELIEAVELTDQFGSLVPISLGEDSLGELYVCTLANQVLRIVSATPPDSDCNRNGVSDECDIASGDSDDINGDGVPDECQIIGDIDGDGAVGTPDLLLLLGAWGTCGDCANCPADLNGDCLVNGADLIILIGNWG